MKEHFVQELLFLCPAVLKCGISDIDTFGNCLFETIAESEVSALIYLDRYISPLGEITMAGDGESLKVLSFTGQGCYGMELCREDRERFPVFEETKRWLMVYFSGREPDFMPKLSLRGTAFQMEVWKLVREIPYGQVISCGELAEELAERKGVGKVSVQAVGGAVGHNPVSILVPGHRVVGKNGKLTGFYGGIWRKEELLQIERQGMKNR